ncbi:hypothetical protein D9C73_009449 [Collichthys lucidus]|uniref:Uncharacterized protein n=1 Tax=Collichthys lucidus TaxID=240159 RepID=A0A4U5UNN0_COLLU|nr:hypothetical protein D9C73_009449 [Collichthys lucidus]
MSTARLVEENQTRSPCRGQASREVEREGRTHLCGRQPTSHHRATQHHSQHPTTPRHPPPHSSLTSQEEDEEHPTLTSTEDTVAISFFCADTKSPADTKSLFEQLSCWADTQTSVQKVLEHLKFRHANDDIFLNDSINRKFLEFHRDITEECGAEDKQHSWAVIEKQEEIVMYGPYYPNYIKGEHSEDIIIKQTQELLESDVVSEDWKVYVFTMNSPCLARNTAPCMLNLVQKAQEWWSVHGGQDWKSYFKSMHSVSSEDEKTTFPQVVNTMIEASQGLLSEKGESFEECLEKGRAFAFDYAFGSQVSDAIQDQIRLTFQQCWKEMVQDKSAEFIREKLTEDFNQWTVQLFIKDAVKCTKQYLQMGRIRFPEEDSQAPQAP